MKLVRNNTYNNKIVFVDGSGGSGKVLLASILECLNNTEKRIEDEEIFLISRLYRYGKIDEDAAITYIKTHIDRRIHYLMMGRQLNIKRKEVMSLFNYPYPIKYLKRHFNNDRVLANNMITKENPIFQNMTQNALVNIELYRKCFGNRLYLLYVLRHPTDVICDMYTRKFIQDIGVSVSNIRQTIEHKGEIVPLFTEKYKDTYLTMKNIDRVIRWIHDIYKDDLETYTKLVNKNKIHIIKFDDLVTKPKEICKNIEDLLDSKMTWKINRVLKKQNCPREIDYNIRNIRNELIRKTCDYKSIKLLDRLDKLYEVDYDTII